MATATSANPFACTFEGCLGKFETRGALKHHKLTRHDYCLVCDLDFKDDAAFLAHKVGSEKHITCPICSEDFRSTDGRDRHVRQAHAAEQNLHCVGCSEVFVRAGGLMNHLERNRCTQIRSYDFEKRRALKEMIMAQMASQEAERPGLMSVTSEGGDSGDEDGGVPLNTSSLLDNLDGDSDVDYPTLAPATSASKPRTASTTTPLNSSAWPELEVAKAWTPNEDITEVAEKINIQDVPTTTWGASSSIKLFPNAPKTPATLDWATSLTEPLAGPRASNDTKILESTMDPSSPHFNPYQFRNAIGKFKCPYPKCSKSFPSPPTFTAHLESPAHKGNDHRCPACLKIFKSPTALTQHMEASTNRCKIKETANFGHAVHLVSGGFLTVGGRHADGTVKFETEVGEPHW